MKCCNCKRRFRESEYGYCCPYCGAYNVHLKSRDIKVTNDTKESIRSSRSITIIITIVIIMFVISYLADLYGTVLDSREEEITLYTEEDTIHENIIEETKEEEVQIAVHDENGFLVENGVLTDYNGSNRYITIPEEVVIIAEDVFKENESIETVILNEGLEEIMDNAFYGCTYIEKVHFPTTLRKIGAFAFSDCDKLKSADLKEGLLEVGDAAFFSCDELSSITMPKSMKKVHGDAFRVNAWYYDNYPFYGEFIIGDGILNGIYLDSTVKKLVLPSGIKCVASDIIFLSDQLEEIIIPDGVHTIMERPLSGFVHDADFVVEIPDSVTQIDGILFLLSYTIENNIKIRCSEGSYAYDYALENGYKIEIK